MEGSAPDLVHSSMGSLVDEYFPCAVLAEEINCKGGGLNTAVTAVADLAETSTTVWAAVQGLNVFGVSWNTSSF